MDGGVLQEMGEPYQLMMDHESQFSKLVGHVGPAGEAKLLETAKAAHDSRLG